MQSLMLFSNILGFIVGPAVGGGLQEVCEKIHKLCTLILFLTLSCTWIVCEMFAITLCITFQGCSTTAIVVLAVALSLTMNLELNV